MRVAPTEVTVSVSGSAAVRPGRRISDQIGYLHGPRGRRPATARRSRRHLADRAMARFP